MPVVRLSVVSLPVTDQERALAFYRDALGATVVDDDQVSPDMRWLSLAFPGGGAGVVLATWLDAPAPGSVSGLFLEVEDLDAERRRLEEAGVALSGAVVDSPWGRFQELSDPDGNRLTLHEPAPGA